MRMTNRPLNANPSTKGERVIVVGAGQCPKQIWRKQLVPGECYRPQLTHTCLYALNGIDIAEAPDVAADP